MSAPRIDASEFPFVASLPKREKSRRMQMMEVLGILEERTKERGPVIPQTLAAELLGVSRQRVGQLMEEGRIESFLLNGTRFVFLKSFFEFCREERSPGRPRKVGALKAGIAIGSAIADACDGTA